MRKTNYSKNNLGYLFVENKNCTQINDKVNCKKNTLKYEKYQQKIKQSIFIRGVDDIPKLDAQCRTIKKIIS